MSVFETERLPAGLGSRSAGDQTALLLYHADGCAVVPLREGARIIVGRDTSADVALFAAGLSRKHAAFERSGARVRVLDLGSTNGTLVNGRRVEEAELRADDQVAL